ncbi:MAG: integrase core domain-containing protein [Anaerolineales bacterium]|nr:integrase core domain-containing protein [Anaerolineales bacterium]MCB0032014.1 integrase core domain-containing protein [Anaerolineales bacterium]
MWRSVKHEDIYPNAYETVPELETGLTTYFQIYNDERPHQSLAAQVPADLYFAVNVPTF